MEDHKSAQADRFSLSPRDLLILVLSAATGVAAHWLLRDASVAFGQAVIGGFAAFGATFYFIDRITRRR